MGDPDRFLDLVANIRDWSGRIEIMAVKSRDLFQWLADGNTLVPSDAATYARGYDRLWHDVAKVGVELDGLLRDRAVM